LLDRFQQLHPNVTVISLTVPPDQLVQTFSERVAAGLGPDLLLVDAGLVYDLAQAGLLKDFGQRADIDTSLFLNTALDAVRDGEKLYGLPFAVHTQILYYNTELVTAPPTTLDEWIAQASTDDRVAFNTNLAEAFWGVRAFGGRIFNEEGQWVLDKGGFINWIDTLKALQATPGFVVDNDGERLRTMFMSGEAAFYIGDSRDLRQLQETLGEDKLSLTVLPSGPNSRTPGPILRTDAFALNRIASPQETNLAVELVKFMTNLQQQRRITVEPVGRLPTHTQVRFRQTLSPLVTELAKQSRTTVSIPFEHWPVWVELTRERTEMNDLYVQALSGISPSNRAVQDISAIITDRFNLEVEDRDPAALCPALEVATEPEVTLWHSFHNEEAEALAEIAGSFEELCPGITLQLATFDAEQIEHQYRQAVSAGDGPDVLLASSRFTAQLADEGLVRDVSEFLDTSFMQRFIPDAEAAMRNNGRLYGVPVSVAVLALYYNLNLVEDPLLNLNEVSIRVTSERQFALPATFSYGYWGLAPFGGFEFDSETGEIIQDQGLLNWLNWLQTIRNQPGMVVSTDFARTEELFASGEAAYLISGPGSLSRLRRELGAEKFDVALLPAGPEGPASPILQVQGIMISPNSGEAATATAMAFAKYLVAPESQKTLLRTGTHVSAVVTVDLTDFPKLNGFREQAKVSVVVIETPGFSVVEELGDELFEAVLEQEAKPVEAVENFEEAVAESIDENVTGQ
jgi:arabinogalactan oligomer/maltooligosaccharide transport system substrate-binding protein